jgi:hypothetical protein
MKHRFLLFLLLLAVPAVADQITFSFISLAGNVRDVQANPSGFTAGPARVIAVTDATTGITVPFSGNLTVATGTASSFNVTPPLVLATFTAGEDDTVQILDPTTLAPILNGFTLNNSSLAATFPGGTGALSSPIEVTSIEPEIFAMFNLRDFDPRASLSLTFGQNALSGEDLTAVTGGGSITVTAFSALPEPSTLIMLGRGVEEMLCPKL